MSPNHGIQLKHEINLLPDTPPSWGGAATGTGITRYNGSKVWGAGQVPGRTTDRPGHHAMPTRGQVLSHSTNFHRHFSVTIRTITIIRICCLNNVHNRLWWWWWQISYCVLHGGWLVAYSPYIYHWHAIKQSKGIIDRTSTMEGMFVTNSCNELY